MQPENQSWYYAKDDEQHGPVPFLQLRNMVASGQLTTEDLVWNDSLASWTPFREISREGTSSITPAPPASESHRLPIPADLKRASFLKLIVLGAVAFLLFVGCLASLFYSIGGTGTPFDSFLTPVTVILGIAALTVTIWGVVVAMIYLHRAWRMIQGFGASITPGIAVGLLFIPLFTLYWHFRSYLNWSREYNDIVARNPSLQMAPRATEPVFLAFCVCQLISGILDIAEPFADLVGGGQSGEAVAVIGGLVGLGSLVCMIMVFFQICNAINFFIEVRDRQEMERHAGV